MSDTVEKIDGKLVYWLKTPEGEHHRRGIIIDTDTQTCVTDEIASGYDLAYGGLRKVNDGQ